MRILKKIPVALLLFLAPYSHLLAQSANAHSDFVNGKYQLTIRGAEHFAQLPLHCMQIQFPYKTGVVFGDSTAVLKPIEYHPAFYGCYDWHSSVHGHWMLVRLLKMFPDMTNAKEIRKALEDHLTAANIRQEMQIFTTKNNTSFERPYGWAWVLKLQEELQTWNDPMGKELAEHVKPMASQLSILLQQYLPKMSYPIREGEHPNTAFAMRLAWDYAQTTHDAKLISCIKVAAHRLFSKDTNAPLRWEPSGNDFLSPILEEADLMWRVMPPDQYQQWLKKFLPALSSPGFRLPVAQTLDRSDGKFVHLDGLNLSRACVLYSIADHAGINKKRLKYLANQHLLSALPHVANGEYLGDHWLATFAVFAMTMQ